MKLLDKLKNALFEEEYVEVEEKPIRKEKPKEKPIAKKIVLPKEKEEEVEEKPEKKEFVFPMMEEEDFIDLTRDEKKEEPHPVEEDTPVYRRPPKIKEKKEEVALYTGGKQKEPEIQIHEYGYEKRKDKKEFTPSPIISPIYGILDKNYKKEDVVSKREVRLSSYKTNNRMDLDEVRKKAYGESDEKVFEEELGKDKKEESVEPKEEEEVFLDISDDKTPTVPKVTVGDAEEYFEDLGLEYNIDYKDASKEKATGRRTKVKEEKETPQKEEVEENLFDLIDSMYEEKEGE